MKIKDDIGWLKGAKRGALFYTVKVSEGWFAGFTTAGPKGADSGVFKSRRKAMQWLAANMESDNG